MLSIDTPETHFLGASQGYWAEKAAARGAKLSREHREVELLADGERQQEG